MQQEPRKTTIRLLGEHGDSFGGEAIVSEEEIPHLNPQIMPVQDEKDEG